MRVFSLGAACVLLLTAVGCEPSNRTADQGSVVVTNVVGPQTGPRDITFTGALRGTSEAQHQACQIAGEGPDRTFTMTATGELDGRTYFLSLAIYRYVGPHAYELHNPPADPMYLPSTPRPVPGYPGFLNFVPKYDPGNAFGPDPRGAGRPLMAIEAGEQSGWFDVEMVSLNASGAPVPIAIKGRFVCGPPFQI